MKTRFGIVVLVVLVLASGCDLLGAFFKGEWKVIGTGISSMKASFVRVGIDEINGVIYTAFKEGDIGLNTGSVSVMSIDDWGSSTDWNYVGDPQITTAEAKYIALYLDGDIPYISFMNANVGTGGLSVMKFNGTEWVHVGGSPGGISEGGVTNSDLLVADNGDVYVAYRDGAGTTSNLRVSVFNGASWQPYGLDTEALASEGTADLVDIERDGTTTYVSFTDRDTDGASVISSTGGAWSAVGPAVISSGYGKYVNLEIEDGTPYVAFAEGMGTQTLKVMAFDGAAWADVGSTGVSSGVTNFVSMDFLDGEPIVAYKDGDANSALSVQSMGRRNWDYVGDPGVSSGRADWVSLKAGNAAYYVAYSDHTQMEKVSVARYR